MKNRSFILINILALAVLLVSTACQPVATPTAVPTPTLTPVPNVDAGQLLTDSFNNVLKTSSLSLAMQTTLDVGGLKFNVTGEGAAKPPEQSYFKINVVLQQIELLQTSLTQFYIRRSANAAWEPITIDQVNTQAINPNFFFQKEGLLAIVQNPTYLGEGTLAGAPVARIGFAFDTKQILASMAAMVPGVDLSGITGTGTGEIMIDRAKQLPRQMNLNIAFDVKGVASSINLVVKLSNYNGPVTIPTP